MKRAGSGGCVARALFKPTETEDLLQTLHGDPSEESSNVRTSTEDATQPQPANDAVLAAC